MRLIIYHENSTLRTTLAARLTAAGHAILENLPALPAGEPLGLAGAIARLEPHAVLLDAGRAPALLADTGRALATLDVRPAATPGDNQHPFIDEPGAPVLLSIGGLEDALAQVEALVHRAPSTRKVRPRRVATRPTVGVAHADRRRAITFGAGYQGWHAPGGLHRPGRADPGWQERCAQEEGHLVLLLQTCLAEPARPAKARAYLDLLSAAEPGLEEEIAYRLAHGSWKGYWLREHLCRLCAVIAHLLPDTEYANFPPPVPPLSRVAHLHAHAPDHFTYPVLCLLGFEPNPLVAELLTDGVTSRFIPGQSEAELALITQRLWGACAYLRAVGRAHLQVVADALDAGSDFHGRKEDDALPRHWGVVLEFWGWRHLLAAGMSLRHTVGGVLAGTTRVPPRRPGQRAALSYAEMSAIGGGGADGQPAA